MASPTIVQGYTGQTQGTQFVLENNQPNPGEPILMPLTSGSATMSLTTQPNTLSPTTGMQLHFYVIGNTSTGTIGIVGTDASGNAQTSQTYHVAIAPQNAQGYTEFTTKEVWDTVTASNITLSSGLYTAGCQVMVFGSAAGKYLLPITTDEEEKITHFSPEDKRGILWKDFRVTPLTKGCSVDKMDCSVYSDSLWMYYMLIGSTPVITTAPASPVSLLAATTRAATMTLTTGLATVPPGMFLIFTPGGNSATGTITLSGLDQDGLAASETINVGANNNPVYSTHRYSALTSPGTNQFATTGLTGAATIAVTAVFGWTYTWTYDGITNPFPLSACLSIFDGVMGKKLPGVVLSDGTFTYDKQKEFGFSGKGSAQDLCIVGDPNPTTYPSGISPFATLAQPTSLPMVSWPATFWLDGGAATPFTTQRGDLLTCKIQLMTGRKWEWAGSGMQRADFVTTDAAPNVTLDGTGVFYNYSDYVSYFKQNVAIILGMLFQGKLLGANSGTVYFENVKWTLPAKFDTYKVDKSKNAVEVAWKTLNEYNAVNLGYAYKVAVTTATPPTYTN